MACRIFKPRFTDSLAEKVSSNLRPRGSLNRSFRIPAKGKMLEAAVQQVFRAQPADCFRIRYDVDHAGDFRLPMPDYHRRQSRGKRFLDFLDIPEDNAVRPDGSQSGPGFFQPARFPIKRPTLVLINIISNALE